MTISSTTRKAGPFSGTGAQTAYPFNFKVFAAGDLLVVQTDASGVEFALTLGTHYSVSLNANQDTTPGGIVTMVTALPAGQLLTLSSAVPLTQGASIPNMGGFYPKVIEQALDKLTIAAQQVADTVGRCIRLAISDSGVNGDLPATAARAGKFLAFDAGGNPTVASGTGADAGLRTDLASNLAGTALVGFTAGGIGAVPRTARDKLRESVSVSDYLVAAASDATLALQNAIYAAATLGRRVYVDTPCNTSSAIAVPSGSYIWSDNPANVILGAGNHGLFSLTYPSEGTTFDGLVLDGNKTSGTADVVTLIYAPGSVAAPTQVGKRLVVRNCTLRNGSAGVAFENARDCNVHDNHIEAMYRHTSGPYAGSYGYGVVFNGCTNSKIHDNPAIGTADAPCERHGIYLPVFRDADSNPTVLNFCSSIQIFGNRISVKHDPANEPFSSCVESWNYFDISIIGNHLIGGVRGINSAPDYMPGSRVQIIGNLIKDNEIYIRNGPTDKGAAPGTYYFDEYQISGNMLIPLSSVTAQQGVFFQGVKKVIFNNNYVRGSSSNTFAFGYYDLTNNIAAELIASTGNVIVGFAQGFYLANVNKFSDDSSFELFTGNPLPYVRNANISQSEMEPRLSPFTSLYGYNTVDWNGVRYFEAALEKYIRHNGTYWVDAEGLRVRGPTANRPSNSSVIAGSAAAANGDMLGIPYGFRYYDEDAGAMLYWNGVTWATAQQPAIPLGATTADLNTFKTTYPAAMNYGATSWNLTTSKPVWFNSLTNNWVYSDGTAI